MSSLYSIVYPIFLYRVLKYDIFLKKFFPLFCIIISIYTDILVSLYNPHISISIGHYVEFNHGYLIENNYIYINLSLNLWIFSFRYTVVLPYFPYFFQRSHIVLFNYRIIFNGFYIHEQRFGIHPLEARKTRFASLAALRAYPVPGDSFVPIR